MMADEVWNTTSTAARQIKKSEQWVREAFDAGKIHGRRDALGRRLIPQSEIDRMLAAVNGEREAAAR